MMCSHGSLNAVKMLGPSYNLLPKYASDFHALRSLISLCFGRASLDRQVTEVRQRAPYQQIHCR
jgi:hypothetical protein